MSVDRQMRVGRDAWTLLALVAAFSLALVPSVLLHPGTSFDALRFLALHTALILIPGLLLGRGVLPDAPAHAAIAIGSVFSTAFLVLAGILDLRFGLRHALLLGPFVASVLGFLLARKESRSAPAPLVRAELVTGALVLLAIVIVETIALTVPAMPPTPHSLGAYYPDSLWTVGNTYSIERWGLPLRDIRFSGSFLGYHVAQNIYQSALIRYGSVDAFRLHFLLEPSIDRMTLALVCFTVPSVYRRTSSKAGLLLALGVLFTTPVGSDGHWLIYANPLSYAYSLAPFFVFHGVLFRGAEARVRAPWVQLGLAFGLAVSSKGNLLLLVPAGLGGLFLWQLRRRISGRATFIAGVITVVVGAFVYATLFRTSAGAGYGVHLWPVNPEGRIHMLLFDRLKLGVLAKVIFAVWTVARPLITNSVLLFGALGPALLLILVAKRETRGIVRDDLVFPYVVTFAAASMLLISIFEFVGGYVYFFEYAQLLCLLLVAYSLDEWSAVARPLVKLSAAFVAAGVALFAFEGARWARHWGSFPGETRGLDPRATLDVSEVAASKWLAAHAQPDDVFVSNRHVYTHELDPSLEVGRFFGYSALSGLQAFAEGEAFRPAGPERERALERWRQVDAFFDEPDARRRVDMLRPMGVRWVVQCRRFKDRDLQETPGLSLVFDEPSIRIFRVD